MAASVFTLPRPAAVPSPAPVEVLKKNKKKFLHPALQEAVERCRRESKAAATRRAYENDWRAFTRWCRENECASLPADPDAVAAWIASLAESGEVTAGTIQRRLSAVAFMHLEAHTSGKINCPTPPTASPEVKVTMNGIRRRLSTLQLGKSPTLTSDIAAMVRATPEGKILGVRDRALLLVGYAGAFRRSELVALNFEDVEFREDGLKVTIKKSKTDQEGAGQVIGIVGTRTKLCPVAALSDWLETGGITSGPIFRAVNRHGNILGRLQGKAVAIVVKRYAAAAGLDPAKYAGHSLRAGFATQAARNGVHERSIMDQTRHGKSDTLQKYIRDGSLFRDNASGRLGL